jgi:hypothetical protein
MAVNSRRKGAAFERQIARDLRTFLHPDRTGQEWQITRAQTDRQRGQDGLTAGEFTIIGPGVFPWAIECKAGEAFKEAQLWQVPASGPVAQSWWPQAVRQAASVGLSPVLIVKRRNGPILAIAERKVWSRLLVTNPRHRFTLEAEGQRWDLEAVLWSAVMRCPPSEVFRESKR